jgi:hypothetical protein
MSFTLRPLCLFENRSQNPTCWIANWVSQCRSGEEGKKVESLYMIWVTYLCLMLDTTFIGILWKISMFFCFFISIRLPYCLTGASFRTIAHTDLSSAFFLHLLAPIYFRSCSIQSNHLNFGLPAFLLPSGFPRITSFTVHQTFLLDDQPILVFLLLLLLQYLF